MKDEIINLLKKNKNPVSGAQISKNFCISRTAIWKHIEELRKDGYKISAQPHKGYSLISLPDRLYPREVKSGLETKMIGNEIVYLRTVDSTMSTAFDLGMKGKREGLLVIAEEQTKGKGRLGRRWSSPKHKGIYISILLKPKFSMVDVPKLTLMSGVAACEAIRSKTGLKTTIKWPNDILINNKKIGGILTEASSETDIVHFVIIGIGINVNTPLSALPENAASIKNEKKEKISRIELLQQILLEMEKNYRDVQKNGFLKVIEKWKELSSTLGKEVKAVDHHNKVSGKAVDLDEFGRLVIKSDSGKIVRKISGDVIQV